MLSSSLLINIDQLQKRIEKQLESYLSMIIKSYDKNKNMIFTTTLVIYSLYNFIDILIDISTEWHLWLLGVFSVAILTDKQDLQAALQLELKEEKLLHLIKEIKTQDVITIIKNLLKILNLVKDLMLGHIAKFINNIQEILKSYLRKNAFLCRVAPYIRAMVCIALVGIIAVSLKTKAILKKMIKVTIKLIFFNIISVFLKGFRRSIILPIHLQKDKKEGNNIKKIKAESLLKMLLSVIKKDINKIIEANQQIKEAVQQSAIWTHGRQILVQILNIFNLIYGILLSTIEQVYYTAGQKGETAGEYIALKLITLITDEELNEIQPIEKALGYIGMINKEQQQSSDCKIQY